MFNVRLINEYHSLTLESFEGDLDSTEAARLCYQALIGLGYSPKNVLDSFQTIAEEVYDSLN